MPENAFTSQAVRRQLERIVSTTEFAQSPRMCRFLRLAVEYSLEGRASELKEYLIGVEVFDRPASFDPRADPIVRVEARRLRTKLEKYYKTEGKADEITIQLPKGAYAAAFNQPAAPPPVQRGAIAVLPFANLSNDESNEYFSDGLTQELIHGLTRVPGLRVLAWDSSSRLKNTPVAELGVAYVVTGSVRCGGNRLRIAAQLVDTASSLYLWSEVFDREVEDLLQIQDDISRAIVGALRLHLPASAAAVGKRPFHFEAHNHYLKGRFHWNKRTREDLAKAAKYFEQSIALDPGFALGWAGLADTYSLRADYSQAIPSITVPRAKHAALRAIELDPSLGEAWTSLALIVSLHEWQWAEAERYYRRAIELNPGYATVHMWYGIDFLAVLGRFEEAKHEVELACATDPWSVMNLESRAYLHLLARRYDEALAGHRESIKLDPGFYKPWTSMGRALIQKGEYDAAIEMLEKGRSLGGVFPNILGALGQAHALAGRPERAREFMESLRRISQDRYVNSTCFAMIHMGLGENDEALSALEKGAEEREVPLAILNVHPAYDQLRNEERFKALVLRLRLASRAEP